MAFKLLLALSLICTCYGHYLPEEFVGDVDAETILNNEGSFGRRMVVILPHQNLEDLDNLPNTDLWLRSKRQVEQRPPMESGRRGQIEVYGEHRERNGKSLGSELNVQGTGRIWESRDGRSTLDANANYNRHYGGPYGTSRPNYGGGVNFNHRF